MGAPKGRIPWNKGLTKETDRRVKKNGKCIVYFTALDYSVGIDGGNLEKEQTNDNSIIQKKIR